MPGRLSASSDKGGERAAGILSLIETAKLGGIGRRCGTLVITICTAGRIGGTGLGHAFAPASVFRKVASPASDTSTHFGSGEASAA
jgi:hypothetical protein